MPEGRSEISNSQTLVIDFGDLTFEPVEQQNGVATVIKFKLENPSIGPGDVLLVLAEQDIQFHGFIGGIENGWGIATDRNGSSLPASIQ
ncbi:MAG: hypothetical protein ACKVZH_11675 [Blastocatellia bacterium]